MFEFALSCGHLVSVALTGWYPVVMSCCDRLGGTVWRGIYRPFDADIDFARLLFERYEWRPKGTPLGGARLIAQRRARIDDPGRSTVRGIRVSSGRYPERVGAISNADGSALAAEPG